MVIVLFCAAEILLNLSPVFGKLVQGERAFFPSHSQIHHRLYAPHAPARSATPSSCMTSYIHGQYRAPTRRGEAAHVKDMIDTSRVNVRKKAAQTQ
jgi:hypothetical protein